MAKRQPLEIAFPVKGLDETWAFRRQPKGSTPDALNVRPFDPISHRLRGGQRGGHTDYFASAVNGSNPIQAIAQVTSAFDPDSIIADELLFSEDFSQTDGILDTTHWYLFDRAQLSNPFVCSAALASTANGPLVKSNAIAGDNWAENNTRIGMMKDNISIGTNYVIRFVCQHNKSGINRDTFFMAVLRAGDPASPPITTYNYGLAGITNCHAGEPGYASIRIGNGALAEVDLQTTFGFAADFWATPHVVEIRVAGNTISVWIDNLKVVQQSSPALSGNSYVGFAVSQWTASTSWSLDNLAVYTGISPASARTTKLVAVSGGRVYAAVAGDAISEALSAAVEFNTSGRVALQEGYSQVFGCDGTATHYAVYSPSTNTVADWEATAGVLPVGTLSDATSYDITTASSGSKTFTVAEDLSTLSDGDYIEIAGSASNDGAYTVAGTAGSSPTVVTVDQDVPADFAGPGTDGTLTEATAACRIIALYRGRVVLAGLPSDPQNWFMSAVGDPTDWDYSPAAVTATQAVAGNSSDAGKLGDVVTALAPYSDDLLIIGGDHTIWVMRGDPAAGGILDNISYQAGIAGPEAFAWDPYGNLYFFGTGNLWRLGAGATSLESISRNKLDQIFGQINYATYNVRLLWDEEHKGLHLYLTPSTQPVTAPIHYYWDQRTESFWPDQLPVTFGPTAVWIFDADDPDDRATLIGCFDSYIRYIDNGSATDDGTAINSYVEFTPIVAAGDMTNVRLIELTALLGEDSDPVQLQVYADDSVQKVLAETTPRYTRTLEAGRNPSIRQRVIGNAIRIRLENYSSEDYRWALESLMGIVTVSGKTRKGHV